MQATAPPPTRPFALFALIGTTLLDLVIFVFALPFLVIGPMLFDAPGSETRLGPNLILWGTCTALPVCIVAVAVAWALYWRHYPRPAVIISLLPLVNLAVVLTGFFLFSTS